MNPLTPPRSYASFPVTQANWAGNMVSMAEVTNSPLRASPLDRSRPHAKTNEAGLSQAYIHGNELYCVCRQPYDPSIFMIGCDLCDGWYHARCVNISEDTAKLMESYTCPRCVKQQKKLAKSKVKAAKVAKNRSSAAEKRLRRSKRAATKNIDYEIKDDLFDDDLMEIRPSKRMFEDEMLSEADDSDVLLTSDEEHDSPLPAVRVELEGSERDDVYSIDLPPQHISISKNKVLEAWKKKAFNTVQENLQTIVSAQHPSVEFVRFLNTYNTQLSNVKVEREQLQCYLKHREILSSHACSIDNVPKPVSFNASTVLSEWSSMHKCLNCQGMIPWNMFHQHLHECLEQSIFKVSWKPSFQICAFPLNPQEKDLSKALCSKKRKECCQHAGWESISQFRLVEQEYFLETILFHLKMVCSDLYHTCL